MLPGCMSAWKKPSRNTWVKKIVTPSRASLRMSTPACAQPLDLADRHAVHALHHDHLGVAVVPVHLRDQHQVQAAPCCGAAGRRWRPRAPGPARRAGTCRTRPPPRAASGAGRRRDSRSTQPAIMRISARSFSITGSMPGRSTFTATSRSSPPLSISVAKCTCAIEALATGSRSKLAKIVSSGRRKARSMVAMATLGGERRHAVLQQRQFVGDVGRQQVAPGRQHLAELDEDRAQVLQRLAQALAARRRQVAAEREDAGQRAQPGPLEAGEDQLVQAVAQGHPDDEDRRASSASCAGLPWAVGARSAPASAPARGGRGGRELAQRRDHARAPPRRWRGPARRRPGATGLPRGPSARGPPAS